MKRGTACSSQLTLLASLLLCLALACARRAEAPDWIQSAPAGTVAAVSCATGWVLVPAHAGPLLQSCPSAERALALLMQRTRTDRNGGGRVTLYLGRPGQESAWLIQLGGLRNPGALQVAIADAFPADGTLAMDYREQPLFAILDEDGRHLRAVADGDGRVWLGDRAGLARLDSGRLGAWNRLAGSAAWISRDAPVQGFILPQDWLADSERRAPGELGGRLPRGIQAMAWAVLPGIGPATQGFELSLTGSRTAIRGAAPWLQDFVAAAQALPGAPAQLPELLQENRRLGMRWQLTQAQLDVALARLNQPSIQCP